MPAVYNVTTTLDVVNANDGLFSLREAVIAANASVNVPDTINLTSGTYTLMLTGANEDAGAKGDLDVRDELTIQGPGAANTIINGNRADRVFDLRQHSLSLSGLTVEGGLAGGTADQPQGGGIRSAGQLTLSDCAVRSNEVQTTGTGTADGGGIYANGGTLRLIRTTVSENRTVGGTARGGGVYVIGGTAVVTDSAITDNSAVGSVAISSGGGHGGSAYGGGIYDEVFSSSPSVIDGSLTILSTTIGGNRAEGGSASGPAGGKAGEASGGGLYTRVPTSITDSAVVNNQATGGAAPFGGTARGGAIFTSMVTYGPGTLTIGNSTISTNRATGGAGTTIGGNGSGGDALGGGVYSPDECVITNSTIALNTAAGGTGTSRSGAEFGGGVLPLGPDLIVASSILAGNSAATGPDVNRPASLPAVTSLGHNLVGLGRGVAGFADGVNGDQVGGATPIDPRLGPLTDNGGNTPTHALLADSPAIDRGSNSSARLYDQRGPVFVRAFGTPDVGAVERTVAGVPTATASLSPVLNAGAASWPFPVTFADDVAVAAATIRTGVVTVTGPNGYAATPALLSLDAASDGPSRRATFEIIPPGGSWDGGDAGVYTVSLVPGVTDTAGNAVPSGLLGSFVVDLSSTVRVSNTNDSGPGSLRQAVLDANLTSAADTIVFDPAVFAAPRTIVLTSGMLNVHTPLTVAGPGAEILTVSGNNASRMFYFDGPGQMSVTLSGLTLTAGRTTGRGGAVMNVDEKLTVQGCVFTANSSTVEGGGAIGLGYLPSTLTVRGSSFTSNTAFDGGAMFVSDGWTLLIDGSTLAGNSTSAPSGAGGRGGAIYFGIPGTLSTFQIANSTFSDNTGALGGAMFAAALNPGVTYSIRNSTVSGNTATADGGGFEIAAYSGTSGTLTVQSSTVVGNRAPTGAGGGFSVDALAASALAISSSIVSGNTALTAPDIASVGTVDLNHSAVGSAAGFTPSPASGNNLPFGANLLLGPLADNGGPTRTHALLAGSQAINAGSNPANLATDQRGPGFVRVSGGAPDIGAFEVQMAPLAVTSVAVNAGAAQRSTVNQVTVTFAGVVTLSGQPEAAFQLARTGPSAPIGNVTLSVDLSGSTAAQTIAKLTFSGPLTEGPASAPSLIDGNYTLTVLSSQVVGGLTGGDNVSSLFRLYGDVNGDKAVNGLDLTAFRNAFGSTSADANYVAYLDLNGDGAINGTDLTEFRTRFGTILP